jgi:O-antigen ligase
MKARKGRTGHERRYLVVVYVACLLCLVGAAGRTWRVWRVERRGIERAQDDDVGLQMGTNVALEQYDRDALIRVLDDVGSLGFVWVRQRFPWRQIEPEAGVRDWALWDALVAETSARGLGIIAVLDDPPAWALRHDAYPLPCLPPCQADAYARFVSAFAQRYREAIDHYQVWDEPNLSRSWGGGHVAPCGYAVLLQAAYEAIHAADPTAQVLGGALAPTQAPGPADLNDLIYLRQLYAAGGGAYFDLLVVKPYGFWSGPWDRRVEPDVLNYSRIVAAREVMRTAGDGDKPAWAVEWGWNALPADWMGDPAPWGTDAPDKQQARIADAIARARTEWPWLDVLCWADYQPHVEGTNPRWGFALRDPEGGTTPFHDFFRIVQERPAAVVGAPLPAVSSVAPVGSLLLLSVPVSVILWPRLACSRVLYRLWRWWAGHGPRCHLLAGIGLAALYVLTPWPEWVLVELVLAAAVLYRYPCWALLGAVGCIPFFYAAKRVGWLWVTPSETLLLLAFAVMVLRVVRRRERPTLAWRLVSLDVVWALWVIWGGVSLAVAPDLVLAAREWRLCMLDPALLYVLVRLQSSVWPAAKTSEVRSTMWPLVAWLLSGGVVALVAIVQWVTGALVPAGGVGRVTGVYYSPNHLALYLGRVWPVMLALALCAGLAGWRRRWMWGGVVVLGGALYLTYSRGAWLLAMPAALVTVGWCYRRHLRWWMAAGGLVALLLVASNVFLGRAVSDSRLLDEVRIPVWQSTIEMIADHPWFGVGLDGFRFVYPRYMRAEAWTEPLLYHPHNVWLDATVRLGLPGLVVYVVLVAICAYGAAYWPGRSGGLRQAMAVGCLASLVAALGHGFVDSGYFLADLAWSLGLIAGIVVSAPARPCTGI